MAEEKKKGGSILIKILVLIIVIAAAGYGFYSMYWVKTPAYSVNEIRVAVKNKDLKTFEKYVNMDKICDKAFDDLIAAQGKISGDSFTRNTFIMGIINNLKPGFVSMMKSITYSAIAGDTKKEADDNKGGHDIGAQLAKSFEKKHNLQDIKIKDISVKEQKDGKAKAVLTLYSGDLNKDFDLIINMTQLPDGSWQADEIDNLQDVIVDFEQAGKEAKAQIPAANAPAEPAAKK